MACTIGQNGRRQQDRIAVLEFELSRTKGTLGDLIQALQREATISAEVQAIIARYDADLLRFAKIDARATEVIEKITEWLEQGKDIVALRYYRSEVASNWDRCHQAIGGWSRMSLLERREAVQRDLRRKTAMEGREKSECNPSSSSTPSD